MIRWLLAYVLLVNLVAFCLCGVDKRRAKKGRWRIAERTLLTAALLGGSPGLLLGMRRLGGSRASTVMVGDQLLTDVLAAHLAGMRAYMLQPLVEQDLPHTLLLRNLERMMLGSRQPEPAPPACRQNMESRS